MSAGTETERPEQRSAAGAGSAGRGGSRDADAQLEGTLERIVFTNPETGWSVVRLLAEPPRAGEGTSSEGESRTVRPAEESATAPGRARRDTLVTAVGNLHGAQPGERLRLTGHWEKDAKYGRQFRVASFLGIEPRTLEGIEKYLGSGLVNGIGPAMAGRLVERFGVETLEIIEREPERLREVPGIGPKRAQTIRQAYVEQRELRDAMVFLQSYGVTPGLAVRICQRYGAGTVALVRRNPYRLAEEMWGVGFKTADEIATSLGFGATSMERVRAGVLHAMARSADDGHVFLPRHRLVEVATTLLGVDSVLCERAVDELVSAGALVEQPVGATEKRAIYSPELFRAETGVTADIDRLLAADAELPPIRVDRAIDWFEQRQGFEFAGQQREAIRSGLTERITVITGGPGTGKTTLVRAITEILTRKDQRILLAAPTGRAANRLAEATGLDARTIHRLLEFDAHRHAFQRGPGRPLEVDVLIVDEVSMLDCSLTHLLLAAMPTGSRLVLLGDADQLPSVGPGRVLDDLIDSGRVPVVALTEIFRQAAASRIVRSAHLVNRGQMPPLEPDDTTGVPGAEDGRSDFFFIERTEPEDILETLLHLVTERIPSSFGFDPLQQIQVLTPMRRGILGTNHLNRELQARLNPTAQRVQRGSLALGVGDRVMQVRNNYDLGVFNGDIGTVRHIDSEAEIVAVDLNGREVAYGTDELEELVLAYACSIHKSQGSEYPCVVLPLHSQHHVMLERNLLYTALTRARELVVIVGTRQAVRTAVRNHRPRRRFTLLADRLRGEVAAPRLPTPEGG